jgi:hypothetical protein
MSSFEFVEGEEILLRATLKKDKWKRFRCVQFSNQWIRSVFLSPIALFYWACGDSCRESEADSFELVLTNQNLHFQQKLYECGCCCQTTGTKIIPLDRIQDIALVSDCCGDCCHIVDIPGEVYQFHVQTAGFGGMMPELSVFCIDNPREFKRRVLEAKSRVARDMNIIGQSKTLDVRFAQLMANPEALRVLEMLERAGPLS